MEPREESLDLEVHKLHGENFRFISEGINEDMRDGTIRDWLSKLSVDAQYLIQVSSKGGKVIVAKRDDTN